MPASNARQYRFESFTLDVRTGELSNSGQKVPLREQPVQLLIALLERSGELVSREELITRLWPDGTFVDSERGLNKAVNHLREALGDSAETPRFVETLPRKGYRFIGNVIDEANRTGQSTSRPTTATSSKKRFAIAAALVALTVIVVSASNNVRNWITSYWRPRPQISALAVLPLENLSGDPEQEYFADGITDELITDLAKTVNARISSRTSVMRYKKTKKTIQEIGRELKVDAIVEGTITRSGNRVRITSQLIQVSTDMHLWAETYDRDLSEILDLQNDVTRDIARRIHLVVRPVEEARVVNSQAYGLYLKGRYAFYQYTGQGWRQAIEFFNQSIESDPNFAPAYSGLADAYLVAGAYGAIPGQEALTHAKEAANKALQLDGRLASAHYALATVYAWYDWDWAKADQEFQRALELNPKDPLGRNWHAGFLSLQGKHDEAVEEHELALELDPLSLIVNANLARSLYWARRYDEAIIQARKTLQIDPRFGVALFWLEGSLRHKGLFKEAVDLRMAVATPEQQQEIERIYKSGGFPELLRAGGERFKKEGSLVEAARCFAQIGEKEEAIRLLQTCYEHRCTSFVTLKAEPDFEVLAADARFQTLSQKLK